MPDPLLHVEDLTIEFLTSGTVSRVTETVSFDVKQGETIALVGESGSGKSVTAMAIANLLPENARRRGSVFFEGEDLLTLSPSRMRQIQGAEIAMIFQEPMTALNPVHKIRKLLDQAITSQGPLSRAELSDRRLELLNLVGLPDPHRRLEQYPHELSGGQRQRAMIAMAVAGDPKLLIADEPTTALDVTAQAGILDLLEDLQERLDMSILMITHDMGIVADIADRVVVMNRGVVEEKSATEELFHAPQADYTKNLLQAVPYLGKGSEVGTTPRARLNLGERMETADSGAQSAGAPALAVSSLVVDYRSPGRRFRAVDDITFHVGADEVVGLVGESGSGKSTIGRATVGLAPISSGSLVVGGVDVTKVGRKHAWSARRDVSMVFQDPASSLDPRATIGSSIAAPLRWNRAQSPQGRTETVARLLDQVRLPRAWARRYPHELSGGQRQRVGIARALALEPTLLIADEPTSALDVSVQASVLDLIMELQGSLGFSCLFISHDLSVIEQLSHRVIVLKDGKVVEQGETGSLLHDPQDAYTRRLVAAVPVPDPVEQRERREYRRKLASAID